MSFWWILLFLFVLGGLFFVIGKWLYEGYMNIALQEKLKCTDQEASNVHVENCEEQQEIANAGYISD